MSRTRLLTFTLLPLISLSLAAEIFCRFKLYVEHNKESYYLTAPFFKRNYDEAFKKKCARDVVEYRFNVEHFNENKRLSSWHRGPDWYYKVKPGTYFSPKPWNNVAFKVNSLGFRGKEFDRYDKGRKIRVFCIGESSVFGCESPEGWTWPARLEYHLNQDGSDKYEVINAGQPSFVSLNYLNLIRYELVGYKPDLFIIYGGVNELEIHRNYEKKNTGFIIDAIHKLLYYRLSMFYTLLVEKISVIVQKSPIPMNIYNNKSEENYKQNINKIIEICKKNNIGLIFVRQMVYSKTSLLMSDDLSLEDIKKIQKTTLKDEDGVDYMDYVRIFKLNQLMKSLNGLCKKYNLEMLDFRKQFYVAALSNERLFFDYVHLTPNANDLLARLISQSIR